MHLRPDPKLSAQECCLKVSILPLRFNIDQDALLFLIGFFNQFGEADPVKGNVKIIIFDYTYFLTIFVHHCRKLHELD